jgi:hypothetical protein
MVKKDEDGEIVLLPLVFAQACRFADEYQILPQLSLANMFGWIAYTIYDDFLDEEGSPKNLSIANISTAYLYKIYHQVSVDSGDKRIIEKFYSLMVKWKMQICGR